MSTRNRSTWAADKKAGQAPAVPGYGSEDQDHPAHKPEPGYADYKKGDPDAWAETPNPPPYPEGNPPSVPGYDTEDQDHPAHKRNPRVEKLSSLVEKKAKKALVIASHMLGKEATKEAVELQALDLMDMDDAVMEATLKRLGGGFMADDDMDPMYDMEPELDEVEPMACGAMYGLEDMEMEGPMGVFANALKAIATDLKALKDANQNQYPGPTLGGPAKDEAGARAEASQVSGLEAKARAEGAAAAKGEVHASVFDGMDKDRDGFVTASEFTGSKAIFAAIDVDADGIISKSEYVAAFSATAKKAEDDEDDKGKEAKKADDAMLDLMASLSDDEIAMLHQASEDDKENGDDEETAAKKAAARLAQLRAEAGCDKLPPALKEKCEEKSGKGDDKGDDKGKEAAKKADDDEDEDDEPEDKGEESEGGDEDDDKEAAKKATEDAAFFASTGDPMGLGGDPSHGLNLTAEDEAVLNEIFAADVPNTASALPGDAVEAAMKPQPKQASTGSTAPVGNMTRTASGGISDLSQLWESAPDVSKVFGV